MKINILTCFPEYFTGSICSLLTKAQVNSILSFNIIDIKKYGHKNRVDDTTYGGGPGMIMRVDVVSRAIEENFDIQLFKNNNKKKMLLPSPRGRIFNQNIAHEFSKLDEVIILCNRYEGVDQRVIDYFNFEEISIGNYILLGGETAAMAIIESSCRLIKNVIGKQQSLIEETNTQNCEYDHYTRPANWRDCTVPEVLRSGNHEKIQQWRSENKKFKKIL
jgi:tRNA (guanine37-N1)-methyltransferase